MDYIFAPVTNHDIISYVQLLIAQHHARFRELYPECSIIPKQHYLCHVPEWMEKYVWVLHSWYEMYTHRCGPMTRYWCMRFEGKHSYFKHLAQKTKQFKSISKSLSWRHQQLVCYHLSKSESLVKEMETSAKSTTKLHIMTLICNLGQQCKVNELSYGDLLVKFSPAINSVGGNVTYVTLCNALHNIITFSSWK